MKNDALPFVIICILNFNGKSYIQDCLKSLYAIDYPSDKFNIIFIDNNSTDGSVEYLKESFPEVRVIAFKKNFGFAQAYNKAVALIENEHIVLLNIDTKVTKNWLQELMKFCAKEENIAVCGSKMFFYDYPDIINHAGGQISAAGFGYDIGFGQRDDRRFHDLAFISAACGASMLIKKSIFEELGGFDKDYFMYFEDVDYCWRCWLSGYQVLYVPSSVLYHKYSGIMGNDSSLKVYLTQKNHLLNIVKNFEFANLIRALIISACAGCLKLCYFALRFNFKGILALINGNIGFILCLPSALEKRKLIQSKRVLTDNVLFNKRVIDTLASSIREYFRLRFLYAEGFLQ